MRTKDRHEARHRVLLTSIGSSTAPYFVSRMRHDVVLAKGRFLMQRFLFAWVVNRLQRVWLYAERGCLLFQRAWYASEIEYLERRLAKLDQEG